MNNALETIAVAFGFRVSAFISSMLILHEGNISSSVPFPFTEDASKFDPNSLIFSLHWETDPVLV